MVHASDGPKPPTTTLPSAPPPHPSGIAVRRLVVVWGPSADAIGTSVLLTDGPVHLGRDPASGAKLSLEDGELSRAHATIFRTGEGARIRDDESRNGTYVDGKRVAEAALCDQSVVRVGRHLLVYEELLADEVRSLLAPRTAQTRLLGESVRLRHALDSIARAAASDAPVIVLGETGTGKELAAAEIHERSGRPGAYVPVNCAALPEQLVESELFGHLRGAFTGAASASRGLFGAADQGTIFLDEIGEMPLGLQAKLLRALATGEVRNVGDTKPRSVSVRVVAATNIDLEGAVRGRRFRADLYSRLTGFVVSLPPLRARRTDILRLAHAFAAEAGRAAPLPQLLTAEAAEALMTWSWPFNVRELRQTIRAATDSAGDGPIGRDQLPAKFFAADDGLTPKGSSPEHELPLELLIRRDSDPSEAELRLALSRLGGSIKRVADYFGKDRKQIYRWARRHGIDVNGFRDAGD